MSEHQQLEGEGVYLPVEFVFPEPPITRFADHMLIQHTEHEFIVSFFESASPVLLGKPEDNLEALKRLGSVKAYCVARIVISAGRMPSMVKALQENLATYQAKKCGGEE